MGYNNLTTRRIMQIKPQTTKTKTIPASAPGSQKSKTSAATKPALRLSKDGRLQVAGSAKSQKAPVSKPGKLRSDAQTDDGDIGDIWAEQRFISRQEMILEERRRKARERRQRELGLIGRAKAALVGDPAVKQKLKQKELQKALKYGSAAKQNPQHQQTRKTKPEAKTVEINIALPNLSVRSSASKLLSRINALLPATFKHGVTRQQRRKKVVVIVAVLALVATGVFSLLGREPNKQVANNNATGGQSSQAAGQLTKGTPEYDTILPAGKDIASLGGWTRVSPNDKDPVFAYVDKVGSIQVNVSQQPLPDNFKTDDTEQQIEQLANSFSATEKITVNGSIAHVGTSAKGPQSLIMAKDDLLILIKSTAPLTTAQWTEYVNSLR